MIWRSTVLMMSCLLGVEILDSKSGCRPGSTSDVPPSVKFVGPALLSEQWTVMHEPVAAIGGAKSGTAAPGCESSMKTSE